MAAEQEISKRALSTLHLKSCAKWKKMLNNNIVLLSSSVEIDETYIGGKRHGKRRWGAKGKTPVLGIAQRKGKVFAKVVENVEGKTLLALVKQKIIDKSIVYTDELPAYNPLSQLGYVRKRVHYASKVYVMGHIHTNTIEGFWSLVKRGISGVNHAASAKYLQNYLNKYAFKYNRYDDEKFIFEAFLSQIVISEWGV